MTALQGAQVLVTGGAGTIGSTLVDELLAAGVGHIDVLDNLVRGRRANLSEALTSGKVDLVEGDIGDRDLVHDLTRGKDLVFHQAAIRITQCAEEPRLALEVLVDGTFNVVEAAAEHKVAKLISASSASVYGMAEQFPTTERHHHHNNDTLYGAAKSFNEGLIRSFRAMSGLDYVVLRYFNVYGPRMDVHGLYTEVLVRWMERILDGKAPLIFGDGQQTMDFVCVPDIARANVLAAGSDVVEGVYNIASAQETSLLELAQALLRAMDSDLGVEHGPERAVNGVVRRLADISAARTDLGWEPTIGLEDGLRSLVEWWLPLREEIATVRAVSAWSELARVNVMKPWLGEEETAAVAEVIASGWVAQGPKVAAFEAAFAQAMQSPFAVATSSCTTALHLALVVAGVGAGDDVVVPSFSFIATANAATYVNARPVFADVDPITGNVTAETIDAVLTPTTRAVIAVDQGGVPVDLDPIRELCTARGIVLIEDAACGAGSTYRGRPVGTGADLTAWSFHPRKILTTGEGGMLTTANQEWAQRARKLREHAMSASAAQRHASLVSPPEEYAEIGFNFRMTDLQAAIGLVQLAKLDHVVDRRRELAEVYRAAIADIPGLRLVADPSWGTSNYQSLWLEVSPAYALDREGLVLALAEAGISARRGIMATHTQPAYQGFDTAQVSLPVTDHLTSATLILPLYHQLTPEDQARVIAVIRTAGLN